jgi:hypothetical protein
MHSFIFSGRTWIVTMHASMRYFLSVSEQSGDRPGESGQGPSQPYRQPPFLGPRMCHSSTIELAYGIQWSIHRSQKPSR